MHVVASVHMCTQAYIRVCVHVCVCVCARALACACMLEHKSVSVRACACACEHVRVLMRWLGTPIVAEYLLRSDLGTPPCDLGTTPCVSGDT